MYSSKIEKLNLQTHFLPIYHKTNGNELETAELLSKIAGEKVSNMAVRRYLKKLDEIEEVKEPAKVKRQQVQKEWLEEKHNIITAYQAVIQKALIPLTNAKTDEEILRAVPIALAVLQRAMNEHSFGMNNPQVQINQQIVVFENWMKEFLQIVKEETDGSTFDRIRTRSKSVAHGG